MAAGRIKGITIEIGGNTTGLDKSLKSVNGTIKSTETQLKDVERLLKLDPKNTVLLTQKQKLLEQEIGTTREKLDGLKQANEQVSKTAKNYDAWKEKYEPIKAEIDETKTKLDELKKRSADAEKELASGKISQEKYDALQSEIAETEDKLKSLKKDAKAVDDEFGKPISPKQYDALQREIIETENKLKSLEGGAGKTKTALEKVSDALGSAGGKLDSAANKVMPVSVAVGGIATAGLKVAADFESGMSQVQAITGATGDEFDALREKAVDLGASTSFSSNEVATAMAEMGKAGWDTRQIMDGMEGVLAAAAASGEGLSSVSTIVADAITGFKLEASDATKVADLLTQAANSGTIDINDLGESFKYVAPVAETMGFSIEDCTTALSAMSTAGIKGSQAGTSLRTAFLNMAKPTKPVAAAMDEIGLSVTNADGSFKSMDEILAEMRTSMAGMTDEQKTQILATIAGKDAVAGLSAVLNMSQEEYDKLASSMDNSAGVAKKTASVMQDNLKSKIEQLGGALESLAIKLSETVIPWLTDFVENLTGMIDKFTEMPKGAQKMITALGGIVIAAGPVMKVLGGISSAAGTVTGGLAKISAAGGMGALGATIGSVLAPIAAVVAAVAALAAIFKHLWDTNDEFRGNITETWNQIKETISGFCDGIVERLNALGFDFKDIGDVIAAAWDGLCSIFAPVFEHAFSFISTILSTVLGVITGILDTWGALFSGNWASVWEGISSTFGAVWDGVSGVFSNALTGILDIANVVLGWFGTSWQEGWEAIKGVVSGFVSGIASCFSDLWNSVKGIGAMISANMSQTWDTIKAAVSNKVQGIASNITEKFNAIKSKASDIFNSVKTAITTPIENAKNTIKGIIDKIKDFFDNLKLKIPTPSLPKLPSFGLKWNTTKIFGKEIEYPAGISISGWYKEGGIFNNPSIIGVGEAGPEAVLPIEKLNVMFDRMADSIISGVGTLMRANSGGPGGDVHLDVYLYPNGPKMGEEIVKTYDTYKRRLG